MRFLFTALYVTGALIGLFVSGETISVSAMIGVLMLIGIVVTNAIVLIDRVIRKEKEGYSTRQALIEAGMTRLRPILMTAIATIGALIPLAFEMENGSGGLISKGLAVTVIGGLTSGTITLVIVPIVYELVMKRKTNKTNPLSKNNESFSRPDGDGFLLILSIVLHYSKENDHFLLKKSFKLL